MADPADELRALALAEVTDPDGVDGAARRLRASELAALPGLPADARAAAAFVLLFGDAVEVARAVELAHGAMAQHRPAARIAAAAFDRQRLLAGQPQKFGLWPGPVDPATTDSERAKWGVPKLAGLHSQGWTWLKSFICGALQ